MVMKDQEIIDSILEGLKDYHRVSFRDSDLLSTFFAGKDLTSKSLYYPEVKMLPELVQTDYQYFKKKLIDHLSRNKIPFIQGSDDFLDIFADKDIYQDYVKVYTLQHEIDSLDIIASDPKSLDKERIDALEKMYQLYNQERNILEKYGE